MNSFSLLFDFQSTFVARTIMSFVGPRNEHLRWPLLLWSCSPCAGLRITSSVCGTGSIRHPWTRWAPWCVKLFLYSPVRTPAWIPLSTVFLISVDGQRSTTGTWQRPFSSELTSRLTRKNSQSSHGAMSRGNGFLHPSLCRRSNQSPLRWIWRTNLGGSRN